MSIDAINITKVIDFHGASHGHFLEYLINTWIFNGPRVPKVFTDLGTSHLPREDISYTFNRQIKCGHFTENNIPCATTEKIVRVTVNSRIEQQIHMINVMHRIGDVTLEGSYKLIPSDVLKSTATLRNNWFSKLTDIENSYKLDYKWRWPEIDAFEFPMENLYDLTLLCQTMQLCASFLDQKFTLDQEFYAVWNKFIELNQGLQCYRLSKKVVELALGNINFAFDLTVPEQALTNAILTTTVNMHDGPLFVDEQYATNARQIWQHIQTHLDEFDNKF
jgi:hypothetical protein